MEMGHLGDRRVLQNLRESAGVRPVSSGSRAPEFPEAKGYMGIWDSRGSVASSVKLDCHHSLTMWLSSLEAGRVSSLQQKGGMLCMFQRRGSKREEIRMAPDVSFSVWTGGSLVLFSLEGVLDDFRITGVSLTMVMS